MTSVTVIEEKGVAVYPIFVKAENDLRTYNFFLYKREGSLSLIDAGNEKDESWTQFNETLNTHGFTIEDLDRIILTHNHADHVGLVNRIWGVKKVPVYAHPEAIPRLKMKPSFLKGRARFFEQLYKEMGCGTRSEKQVEKLKKSVDHSKDRAVNPNITPIVHGDEVDGLRAIAAPGHSPNQLMFYDKKRKWLFGGDLLLNHLSANALIEPDEDFNRLPTLVQHVDSLKRCGDLSVTTLFPGHGELIDNHQALVIKRLEKIEGKSERIFNLIQSGVCTANDLAEVIYKKKYTTQFGLVISEIIGHLDYLESKGKVTKGKIDGVWHYESL